MKELGYAGFECNVRFVRGQFARSREARDQIEQTGIRFIGAHMSVLEARPDVFPGVTQGVAALGAECIVMSAAGLSPAGKFEPEALRAAFAADLDDAADRHFNEFHRNLLIVAAMRAAREVTA